jgi:fatty-acyl-CoA synthase
MDVAVPEGHLLPLVGERARRGGNQPALSFIGDGSGALVTLTWPEIERRAWQARRGYLARGLRPGDRVVLRLRTGPDYLSALLGAFWGGLVPSTFPVLPVRLASAAVDSEWRAMVDGFAPSLVVSAEAPEGVAAPVVAPADLLAPDEPVPEKRDYSDLRSLAYVQYTSGSTGRPRGLALHWSAIRSNLAAIARAAPVEPQDTCVAWLPMYHDMGLFGALLTVVHAGCGGVYMDASMFAASPLLWFKFLEEHRATITVTPPSALHRCIDLLRRRGGRRPDFSSLRQILCGSEPVSPQLVAAFHEVLVPCGVPPSALKPVYGLAEATLAVTFPPAGQPPRLDRVEREALEVRGLARPAGTDDAGAQDWVSAGRPLEGTTVRIVDDDGLDLPERRVGRVLIQSPSLMSGTLEEAVLTPRDEGWLDTGDVGYLAGGELYVTGRRKDLIIKYGRNHSPDHLEHLACLADGVRRAVAFGVYDESRLTERIVVLVEARGNGTGDAAGRDRTRLAVRGQLQAAGYVVDDVLLLGGDRIPRTTSGKVRRQACRQMYLAGALEVR